MTAPSPMRRYARLPTGRAPLPSPALPHCSRVARRRRRPSSPVYDKPPSPRPTRHRHEKRGDQRPRAATTPLSHTLARTQPPPRKHAEDAAVAQAWVRSRGEYSRPTDASPAHHPVPASQERRGRAAWQERTSVAAAFGRPTLLSGVAPARPPSPPSPVRAQRRPHARRRRLTTPTRPPRKSATLPQSATAVAILPLPPPPLARLAQTSPHKGRAGRERPANRVPS